LVQPGNRQSSFIERKMIWKNLTRRDRAQRRLNDAAGIRDTLLRRILARLALLLIGCTGMILGMLGVFVAGVLLMGGTKLLTEVWQQSDRSFFFFGLFSVIIGGSGGAVLGMIVWDFFIRKTSFITDETRRRLWRE
jgi:hypothetical protein